MASGSFTGSTDNQHVKPTITWSATANTATNSSEVTATLTYSRTNTGYTTWGTWSGGLTINGDRAKGSKQIEIEYNSNTVAISHSVTVKHNDDGTKSITISADGGVSSATNTTISKTVTLDTIARKSTVSAGSANVGSALKIDITRKSTNFTHNLWYKFDGVASSWTRITSDKISTTSHSWTIPTSFYAAMSTEKSKTGTILCRTYSGNTEIGDATCSFTANVPQSASLPESAVTFTAVNTDTTVTGNANTILSGESSVRATITASAKNSATISSYKIVNGSNTQNTSSATFNKVTNGKFTATVTDSRGYSVTKTVNLTVVDYFSPTIAVTDVRFENTGVLTFKLKGTYFNGTIDGVQNTSKAIIWYRLLDGNDTGWKTVTDTATFTGNTFETTTFTISGLDYTKTYRIQPCIRDIKGKDILGTTIESLCKPIFDWSKDDFNFNVPVTVDGFKMVYRAGDSVRISQNSVFAGLITGNTSELFFTIPINRPICASGLTVSGRLIGRSVNGYINDTAWGDTAAFYFNTVSGHHTTTAEICDMGIRVRIVFNAAIVNATNNRPCTVSPYGDLTITFK